MMYDVVLVTGSRFFTDREFVEMLLIRHLHPSGVLINGAQKGADNLSSDVAFLWNGVDIREFEANWKEKGAAAGPIRNQEMLKHLQKLSNGGMSCGVVAIHETQDVHLQDRGGTRDMILRAMRAGFPVHSYSMQYLFINPIPQTEMDFD